MLSSVFIFLPVYKLCYCPHPQSMSENCSKIIPNPKEGEGAGKSPLRLSHMAKSYQTLLGYWSCTEFQHSETDLKNIMWDPPIIILQLFFCRFLLWEQTCSHSQQENLHVHHHGLSQQHCPCCETAEQPGMQSGLLSYHPLSAQAPCVSYTCPLLDKYISD